MDSVIKGNQWILSCYGPFRDKPCVPNFIEDQSFEEMRALCYDAKTTGTIPNVGQLFQDAKNKMSLLYEVNNQTLNIIENLYNAGETVNSTSSSSNPFAIGGVALPAATASNSIFGQSNTGVNAANPFASASGGSVFGGGNTTTSGNVFGGSSVSSTGNVFGGSATSNAGIFGGASAFGTPAAGNRPVAGGNIFGQPATVASANPFTATSNIFGQSSLANPAPGSAFQQNNSVFGGAATFSQPSGIFGAAAAAVAQPSTGSQSIFGQSSLFGAANQSNVFGAVPPQGQSIFGSTAVAAAPSVFGAAPPTQPSQGLFASVFATTPAAPSQQSIFGAVPTTQVAPPPNPFGTPVTATPFGNATTQPASATSIFGDASSYQTFGLPAQQQQTFGSNPFQQATATQQTGPTDETLFTKIEALNEDVLNWFNADHFDLGCIPTCPPPRELCI